MSKLTAYTNNVQHVTIAYLHRWTGTICHVTVLQIMVTLWQIFRRVGTHYFEVHNVRVKVCTGGNISQPQYTCILLLEGLFEFSICRLSPQAPPPVKSISLATFSCFINLLLYVRSCDIDTLVILYIPYTCPSKEIITQLSTDSTCRLNWHACVTCSWPYCLQPRTPIISSCFNQRPSISDGCM